MVVRKGGPLHERVAIDDLHVRPHALMARAAILVARHEVVAGLREGRAEGGDVARLDHRVEVRVGHEKAVHDVGAGGAKGDGRVRRHHDALRRERVLLRDHAHRDGAVRFERAAEIGFDEFARDVQRFGVDDLDARRRHHLPVQAREDHDRHHGEDERHHERGPAALRARGHFGAGMGIGWLRGHESGWREEEVKLVRSHGGY